LWISDDLEEMVAVGSVEELFQLSGVRVTDLHKEHVDQITIPSKQGRGLLRRVDEVRFALESPSLAPWSHQVTPNMLVYS